VLHCVVVCCSVIQSVDCTLLAVRLHCNNVTQNVPPTMYNRQTNELHCCSALTHGCSALTHCCSALTHSALTLSTLCNLRQYTTYCNNIQPTARIYNLLQQYTTYCNNIQPTATIYNLLHLECHCLAVSFNLNLQSQSHGSLFNGTWHKRPALQHTATHCNTLQHTATHCNTLQHTATHGNTRQHTATHCNTRQHTATHCNTLQSTKHLTKDPENEINN